MSLDETINAYFVTTTNNYRLNDDRKDENEKRAANLKEALNCLRNHIPEENIREINAADGFPLIASGRLTKKDVFIFDCFEGDFFHQLQQTKSLLIGPPCLISCLRRNEAIPLGTSPVYSTAMRDLNISASGITLEEKTRIRSLTEWMGGHYFHNFGRNVTHLVSNTIKSTKYENATLNGIPVMHFDWVQRVWDKSSYDDSILAIDEEFDKYKLPIFFGTNITCTGLDTTKKNEIMCMVQENGGNYHRAFRSSLVDIVITEKNKTDSDKYKAAVRYKKDILTPEWIFDSVKQGFALPTNGYQVKSLKASTPTKADQTTADFLGVDNTQLSDISRISTVGAKRMNTESTINDTQISVASSSATPNKLPTFLAPAPVANSVEKSAQKTLKSTYNYRLVLNEICPKLAKKAGNFLDGCCIYLSGFQMDEKDKLNRILNVGGAIRYDALSDALTHIIVGNLNDKEFRLWKNKNLSNVVHIVQLNWLLESIKLQQPANEGNYRITLPNSREPETPSPSSKRTLRSMNHSFKKPTKSIKKQLFPKNFKRNDDDDEDDGDDDKADGSLTPVEVPAAAEESQLIAQYAEANLPKTSKNNSSALQQVPQVRISDDTIREQPIASSTQFSQMDFVTNRKAKAAGAASINPTPTTGSNSNAATLLSVDYENLDFFEGMTLYVDKSHFPEEFYEQLLSECEAAHGNLVPNSFIDQVDYAIVSFEKTLNSNTLPVKAKYIITDLYVESCLKVNKLVPIEYYHKHIPDTADTKPLNGMTVVISIYSMLERDFIESLAQLLGANVNKNFVRKEKPLLVCPSPEGSKYEGAIKWGYPVVNSQWLLDCAEESRKLLYKPYLVGDCVEDFPTSPVIRNETNVNGKTPEVTRSQTIVAADNFENGVDDQEQEFTPLRNKRVVELANSATSVRLQTPANIVMSQNNSSPQTPSNFPLSQLSKPTYNFQFMENVLDDIENAEERECLREIIDEMKNNQTPEIERMRRQACTPINRKLPTPKGIPEFCSTPEFERRMAEAFEKRWRLPTKKIKPNTPIDEIRRRVMQATCRALGIIDNDQDLNDSRPTINCTPKYSKARQLPIVPSTSISRDNIHNDTPLTHKPKTFITERENSNFSATKNTFDMQQSDTFVPNTQSPNNSLRRSNGTNNSFGLMRHVSVLGKSSINIDKISFEETEVDMQKSTSNDTTSTSTTSTRSPSKTTPEFKQITEYLRSCAETRRESLKRTRLDAAAIPLTGTELMETESQYVPPFESEQLNIEDMVGWRDPADFIDKRRIKLNEPKMQHKGVPRFSISCSNENKDDIIKKILQLGGQVCENLINFDPLCTHFICERPNRGEKILGCIASGKWVLTVRYIEECFVKEAFIDEELFEWGNCKAIANLPELATDEKPVAQAAHRWRKRLMHDLTSDEPKGAFTGFTVLLHMNGSTVEALKNVIKAGNGHVVEAKPPYRLQTNLHEVTHCFVDVKKCPLSKEDFAYLKNHNVFVASQMYIHAYLMKGSDVDTSKYEVKI